MLNTTSTELACPRGDGVGNPIVINLEKVFKAQYRLDEVACLTPEKAPELLSEYNKNWLSLIEIVAILTAEKNKAERTAKKRASIVLLDEAPKILKSKGVSSSADTRDAVLNSDEEYSLALDRVDQIKAIIDYLKGKAQAFENAFTSVKRLLLEDGNALRLNKPNTSGGMPEVGEPVFDNY